jgi:hypothetical protein
LAQKSDIRTEYQRRFSDREINFLPMYSDALGSLRLLFYQLFMLREKPKIKISLTFHPSNLMIKVMKNCGKDTRQVRNPVISDKQSRGENN